MEATTPSSPPTLVSMHPSEGDPGRSASGHSVAMSPYPTGEERVAPPHSMSTETSSSLISSVITHCSEEPGMMSKCAGQGKQPKNVTDADEEAGGEKTAAHVHGYESSLCAGVDSDGMVQGSLLEDVLTKKRMALMHSLGVVDFLRKRQSSIGSSSYRTAQAGKDACDG